MKAGLVVYNAELTKLRHLRRANSVLRQNSAEHGLNTDALILSTAGLSASGLDWELLGLGPDHTGLLRLMSPSSQSEDSVGEDSAPPVVEVSESPSKASPGFGSLDEESAEHSFIRPSSDSSAEPSTEVAVSGSDSGGLFDDEPDEDPPRKRKRLRQNAVVRSAESSSSKLPAARRLGRPSVDLKRKAASAVLPSAIRSGHKKAQPSTPVPTGGPSMDKDLHSPPHPILEEGEIADDAGFDPGTEASIGGHRVSGPRHPTQVITATVTARRGTNTTTFTPAVEAISRATNSRKLPANAERFLKPGFTAVGAQKAWCNVSLSAPAPKEHSPPLDFAFLALMHNVRSSRHPWRVLYDRMPDEPLTFSLGKFVKGVRISIRASGLGGLVRMWHRFSGHCYEDNEKIDLCVALWERRHWLQVSSMDNAIQAFRKASDPREPFTRFDRLWDWCSKTSGGAGNLPTEVLLEPSYLQYSMEVLEWAPTTEDWSRELRVRGETAGLNAPAEHPYNTTYAPCNPEAPVFVPASMTRQAVISSIAVDQSLADADLVALGGGSGVTEVAGNAPSGVVDEGSADAEIVPAVPAETAEALDEDSFSFAPAESATSGLGSAEVESSATSTGAVTPAHDAEDPPSDIVLAPFEMLVHIGTGERLGSE
ncbi:LOW QUALITY PROTEIN: hypothetical protein PHMEG_00023909 [Phytophthora megakarya]|uniref:Uncharacterized protein n=1 Tax=Phytophthora megakarya TaxID=4795 RepID=A0A225VFQ2_9STRA|nr:LOW QUALITY PROTEIN: hypothetical protein PHMEG_00023909 [Phytophthora megakarya]